MIVGTVESIVQKIAVTIIVVTTDATATRGRSGADERTKNLNVQSKRGWTIIADSIYTKGMTADYAPTTR